MMPAAMPMRNVLDKAGALRASRRCAARRYLVDQRAGQPPNFPRPMRDALHARKILGAHCARPAHNQGHCACQMGAGGINQPRQ